MNNDWVILIGPPGVGKTTIAQEMEKRGYYYHEGDDDLLPEVKALNSKNLGLTPELRDKQHEIIINQIIELTKDHQKLVIAYDFMWDRYRKKLYDLCPGLRWIFLTANRKVLAKRVARPGHLLTPEFALRIADMFEDPSIPVAYINNSGNLEKTVDKIINMPI